MKTSNYISLALLSLAITTIVSCGSDAPKEKLTSYKTLVVKKSDIIVPLKYSARMNGKEDITEGELEEIISQDIDKNTYINNLPDVTFVMKNGTEYEHKGRIITLTGNIDKSTGSASCTARFPNPKGALYSGIQGSVIIPYGSGIL